MLKVQRLSTPDASVEMVATPAQAADPRTDCCMALCDRLDPVKCLTPWLVIIGCLQIGLGLSSIFMVRYFDNKLDAWYAKKSLILMLYVGATIVLGNGILLLFALNMKKRTVMWVYILMSTIMSVYVLVLAVVMINSAINKTVINVQSLIAEPPGSTSTMGSAGIIMGFIVLATAVGLFIGNIIVCAYYNIFFCDTLLLRGNI